MTSIDPATLIPPDGNDESRVDRDQQQGLRARVVKGGMYLAARQGGAVVVGFVGAVALTRRIGPSSFGVYATLLVLYLFAKFIGTLGVDVYLVRSPAALTKRTMDQAVTLILVLAVAVAATAILLLPVLQRVTAMPNLSDLGRPLMLLIPLSAISQVPLAKLERDLRYRSVALIEGTAQLVLYAVALPLAYRGWGAAAGVTGWMVHQILLASALFIVAGYRPSLLFDKRSAADMARYGAGFSASISVWRLRELVNPVVVGHYAGPAAVGFIALAIRLVESLAFVKSATWRMSIAVLGRLQQDPRKLREVIQEGMSLQLLALGPLLVLFACLGRWAVPIAFGSSWIPALTVFPFIGIAYLANAMFNLHSSGLYVVQLNWQVTRFHIVHAVVFVASAVVLVPRVGLVGYGYAEIVAISTYALIHFSAVRTFGAPDYMVPAVWFLAFAAGLFVQPVGLWALAGVLAISIWPRTWAQVRASFAGVV